MAQEKRGGPAGRLARRFGVAGRAAVAAAVVVALALGGAAVVAGRALAGGVVVERAEREAEVAYDGAAAAAEEAAAGTGAEGGDAPAGGSAEEVGEEPQTVVVHVDGAVASPGVYELPAGSRANDAVLAAGGLAEGADTASLNLAAPLSDGDKVRVPLEGEAASEPVGTAGSSAAAGSGSDEGAPVNINTAGIEELDSLPGVGEATARAIVEDREQNGPFSSPEDLMRVSGIGEKKFAKLEAMICV